MYSLKIPFLLQDPKLLLHATQHPRLRYIGHIDEDIVCGVAIQWCAEALLVEMVPNEADTASKNEQAVQRANLYPQWSAVAKGRGSRLTNLDVFFCLLSAECAAITEEINKAYSNATVDVQDQLDNEESACMHDK